ncbi:MAG: EAL domain-containing protein, partial [Pseudomonadota bacterium]
GRNAYRFFTEEMNTYVMDHILMRNGLLRALEHEEFIVHYQPQLDIASGRMTGAEALIRWRHPELGVIMPDRFIGVAEESGLIVEIGRWVMREACRQVRQWQSLSGVGDLRVAVNISALQLRRGDLEQTVHDALEASGLPPSCLELELTESVLLKDYAQSLVVMERLRRLGVKMSIDDFGTGYSSLAYLKQLPVDRLKIDRTFVRDVLGDPDDAAITQAVISLGHILGLDVLAEGVETEAQLAFLREHGCDEFQGYVFSRPLSAEAFERLLTERITMRPH